MQERFNIEYLKILAQRLQGVPAWKELAEACNQILGKEIDEKRRKLTKMRDSVQYRKGDVLVDVKYDPDLPLATRARYRSNNAFISSAADGSIIKTAIVEQVHKNLTYLNHPRTTDFIELNFTYNNSDVYWLMPMDNPQERDIQVKNAFISGFDFFNNKINDEDLQRLYEFIQVYWDEAGADDQFMKFIGFIKNVNMEIYPLWSYDNRTDFFPDLRLKTPGMIPVWEGGKWYLTSHVEVRYDLRQFNETYRVDMSDLEDLFYFFAPIILVLERISPTIDFPFTIAIENIAQTTVIEEGNYHNKFEGKSSLGILLMEQTTVYQFGVYRETQFATFGFFEEEL